MKADFVQNEKLKLLDHHQTEATQNNKQKINSLERKIEPKELSTYQQNLLPEGVTSVEKLLNIYEVERNKKKFKALKEFDKIHTGIGLSKGL